MLGASCVATSSVLQNERVQGYLAGLLEGEGYFYYTRYDQGWTPCIYLRMCEERPIRFFSKVMNVQLNSVQRSYVTRTKGLRTVLLARLIRPMLTGKRRLAATLFENKGYHILNRRTLDEYCTFYRNPLRQSRSTLRARLSVRSAYVIPEAVEGRACWP